jgi:hypothetical protein
MQDLRWGIAVHIDSFVKQSEVTMQPIEDRQRQLTLHI